MKTKFLLFAVGTVLACAMATAQAGTQPEASASGQAGASGVVLANGTAFNAELNSSLDSKKVRIGDPVAAHTTEDARSGGKVVIPKGAKLVGHVTQASAKSNGETESALGVVFDKAIFKNGQEVPLNVALMAIASTPADAPMPSADVDSVGPTGVPAASSGAGANRGALGGVAPAAGEATGNLAATATDKTANVGRAPEVAANTAEVARPAAGTTGGLNPGGQFTSNSRGVFGLNGLNLNTATSSATKGSVITSTGRNVKLDSGTRLLLVAQAAVSAPLAK